MTAVSSLAFPSSRIISAWWKHLAALHPRVLCFRHLLIHEIEAQVAVRQSASLDSLSMFVLRALALRAAQSLGDLQQRLRLEYSLLLQILRLLERSALAANDRGPIWSITAQGRAALEHGTYNRALVERREFCFLDGAVPGRPPQFVHASRSPAGVAFEIGDCAPFAADVLRNAVNQTPEWKKRTGFPLEVTEVLTLEAGAEPFIRAWERVIINRPQQVSTVLALTGAHGQEKILALGVRPETWSIDQGEPFLALGSEWRSMMPEPSLDEWRRALMEWCRERDILTADLESCLLERPDCRLIVRAPSGKVPDRWPDLFREEPWLLAGSGPCRGLARVGIGT